MSIAASRNMVPNYNTSEELAALELFVGYPAGLLEFATACCILFIIVGVPGNLITIIALARYKKIHNATAVFIINLSVCDLLYCLFDLPLSAVTFSMRSWPFGIVMCSIFPFTRFALSAVALVTVLAITVNRYIMISHPRLYSKLFQPYSLAAIIIFSWVFPLAILIPTSLEVLGRFRMDHTGLCSLVPDQMGRNPAIGIFISAFVIPYVTIIACYSKIFYVSRKTMRRSRSAPRIKNKHEVDDSSIATSAEQSNTINDSAVRVSVGNNAVNYKAVRISQGPNVPVATEDSDSATPTGNTKFKSLRTTMLLRRRPTNKSVPTSRDKRLLTMISAIMLAFLICHLPLTIIKVYSDLKPHPIPFIFSTILRYLTACINPVIYVVMSHEYRRAYKKVLSCSSNNLCNHWR